MITKIRKLRGIGVYHDCSAKGEGQDLKKNTAIYANNAYGKSTLVAVLRSLKENCSELIEERNTIGKKFDQTAIISVTGGTIKYENKEWKHHIDQEDCPKLAIFDEQYVQDNLFVKEIEAEHKKKIYQLVVGEEGNKLSDDLNEAIQVEKDKRSGFQTFEKELEQKNKSADVDNYLQISKEIKQAAISSIEEIDKQIKTITNSDEIKKLMDFDSVDFKFIDVSGISELLGKSLEDIHIEAKKRVLEHIKNHLHLNDRAEEFIHLGTELQKEVFPYCGLSFDETNDLIEAYKTYFDDVYNAFQQNLLEKIEYLEAWDFRDEIGKIQNWMNRCENQIAEIKRKSGDDAKYELNEELKPYIGKIDTTIKELISRLNEKRLNPSNEYSSEAVKALNEIKTIVDNEIETFQKYLVKTKENYKHLVDTSLEKPIKDLDLEKGVLQKRINRFSEEEDKWCQTYKKAKSEYEHWEQKREELEKNITEYTKSSFETYEKETNSYLKQLRANFGIGGFSGKTDKTSTEAYVDFCIVIRKQDVALRSRARTPQPQFSNTLSSGDRNTLSLAFFLAWLDRQPNLDELIVIFDDPLTSMDDNRRLGTAQVLGKVSKKVKQLIVLTHKEDFLFQLDDELTSLLGLSIKFDEKNGSEITSYDIKYARKDKHYQRIDDMQRYLEEDFRPSVQEMQENIRKVIEKVLKVKYYPDLEGFQTLKPMLDYLAKETDLNKNKIETLRKLKDISSPVHHAEEPGRPIQDLSRTDLLPEIEKTLQILKTI